eukprot:g2600.t1
MTLGLFVHTASGIFVLQSWLRLRAYFPTACKPCRRLVLLVAAFDFGCPKTCGKRVASDPQDSDRADPYG